MLFGSLQPWPNPFNVSQLNGTNGFVILGESDYAFFGKSVASGDFNGDKIHDLVIGASNYGGLGQGKAYVIFGRNTWPKTVLVNATLDGVLGFAVQGSLADFLLGSSVASGNFNGDNYTDFAIKFPASGLAVAGVVILFGHAGPFPNISILSLTANSGVLVNLTTISELALTLADVNGDKFDDLITMQEISTSLYNALALFGKSSWNTTLTISPSTSDGIRGFNITYTNRVTDILEVVASNDFNGDGIADFLLGQTSYQQYGNGSMAIVFGRNLSNPFPSATEIYSYLNGVDGSVFYGDIPLADFGRSVGSGDFNNDGIADIFAGDSANNIYVIFGKHGPWQANLSVSNLDGLNGFRISGTLQSVSIGDSFASCDFNGDGLNDLIVGAFRANYTGLFPGAMFVIFGSAQNASSSTPTPVSTSPTPSPVQNPSPSPTPSPSACFFQIKNNNIQIVQNQSLRITPTDISFSCDGIELTGKDVIINVFNVSNLEIHKFFFGFWSNVTVFTSKDINDKTIQFVHYGGSPQLFFNVSYQNSTIFDVNANINFTSKITSLSIRSVDLQLSVFSSQNVLSSAIQFSSLNGKSQNVVITVIDSINGYFSDAITLEPISNFTFYDLQNGEITFFTSGQGTPNVTLSFDDGTGQIQYVSVLITVFSVSEGSHPVPPSVIVGVCVTFLVIIFIGGGGAFWYTKTRAKQSKQVVAMKDRIK